MPLFAPTQRYSPEIETVAVTHAHLQDKANANNDEKMWSSLEGQLYPDRLNHFAPSSAASFAHAHPRPSASIFQQQYAGPTPHEQYGSQSWIQAAAGYGPVGAGHRQADVEYGGYTPRRYAGGGGYGGGVVQEQEGYGWSAYEQQPLYPAAPASQGHFYQQQAFYGQGQQQYDHTQAMHSSMQPYQNYGGYEHQVYQPLLTQQWQAANQLAATFNASAPAFTPLNPASAAQQPKKPQQALKSVSAAELNKQRVDKQSRYDQPPAIAARAVDPRLFNSVYATQNVSPPPPPPPSETPPSRPVAGISEWYASMGMPNLAAKAKKSKTKQARKGKQVPKGPPKAPAVKTPPPAFDIPLRPASEQPRSPKAPHLKLIKRPQPSVSYLKRAQLEPQYRDGEPRPLLIVLDLNGTLLYRKTRGSNFVARPRVNEFLHYLLTNHKVMIFSSATPVNVNSMCKKLFSEEQYDRLVAVWARDKLHLTPNQYNAKTQVYKQLSWIWKDHLIASSCVNDDEWAQDSTVLIDDSEEKAASEPHNLLKIDEFEATDEQMKLDVLGQVVEYLEVLRRVRDVSTCMRAQPYVFRPDAPDFDWMEIISDMH